VSVKGYIGARPGRTAILPLPKSREMPAWCPPRHHFAATRVVRPHSLATPLLVIFSWWNYKLYSVAYVDDARLQSSAGGVWVWRAIVTKSVQRTTLSISWWWGCCSRELIADNSGNNYNSHVHQTTHARWKSSFTAPCGQRQSIVNNVSVTVIGHFKRTIFWGQVLGLYIGNSRFVVL